MLLYTEKQLHTAYKVWIKEYCPIDEIPDIEVFRLMFEESFFIQTLCERTLSEH
tara:strand:+ start:427 stop:588 length:162 start_codon:yes stop_codon:yes gene_type:complete